MTDQEFEKYVNSYAQGWMPDTNHEWYACSFRWPRENVPFEALHYFIANLDQVSARIANWRMLKGFETPDTFDDAQAVLAKLALIGGEVGEAVSAVQKGDFENYVEELADTVIRILDLAGTQGLPLADAIAIKMAKNEARPHKHGKRA